MAVALPTTEEQLVLAGVEIDPLAEEIAQLRAPGGFSLTDGQQRALHHVITAIDRGEHCALAGPAGTGKSTMLGLLVELLQRRELPYMLCAPTHKAAGVMRDVVGADADVATVASLLQLKPRMRGRRVLFLPDRRDGRPLPSRTRVLICDESSMVPALLGDGLEKLADRAGAVLVMVGDSAQLPPVSAKPGDLEDQEVGDPDLALQSLPAEQFLNPPAGRALLTQVVRHQGAVLKFATALRECDEIEAVWPTNSHSYGDSAVRTYEHQGSWLYCAAERIGTEAWDADPDRARVVCWSNRQCHSIGAALRERRYGPLDALHWNEGEILANAEAICPPGESLAPPIAPSSCEWRVVSSEAVTLETEVCHIPWRTPERKLQRLLAFGVSAEVAQLKLEPVTAAPGQDPICVYAELPGRRDWCQQLQESARAIKAAALSTRDRKAAWRHWHHCRSWVADIRPAAVLTVHRSQGSTFNEVFVAGDLAWCSGPEAKALHYVAVSRARKIVHVIRR